jgi:hypothetical protein
MNGKTESLYGANAKRSGMGDFTGNVAHFERPVEDKNDPVPSTMNKARTTAAQAQKSSGYGQMEMTK